MLIDSEFGAPWNDQFYWVTVQDDEGIQWDERLVLSGPKIYSYDELVEFAVGMFPYYDIINIRPDEIYR